MKPLTVAFLFGAGGVATAQVGQRPEDYTRTFGWTWAIGTQNAGQAKTWEGGDLRAPTVEEGNKRRPGPARYEDLSCKLPPRLEPVVKEWLRGALNGENPANDIHIVELNRDATPAKATLYQASRITSFVIPALNAEDLDVEADVAIKFAPTSVQIPAQAPVIAVGGGGSGGLKGANARRRTFTNQFKVAIDGLDGKDVIRVSSITARFRPGSAPQISNIVLTVAEHPVGIAAWKAWFDAFVVQGNNADAQEKNGTLELGGFGEEPLLTLGFKGLGIVRMSRVATTLGGNIGTVVLHEIELYCEGMSMQTGAAPVVVAKPPEKVPAGGNAEDRGTRDPEGVPRFPESVRTSFTASRSKISNDERADYVTPASPEKIEAWFAEAMKKLEWKDVSRQESGSPKDTTYLIDLRWAREKQTARLAIGRAKDGATTIHWMVLTPK